MQDLRAILQAAAEHLGAGRIVQAAALLTRALALAPDRGDACYWLGLALGMGGDGAGAARLILRALRLDGPRGPGAEERFGNLAGAFVNRASALARADRHDEAAEACRLVLRIRPDHADALAALGRVHALRNRWAEAAEVLSRAGRLTPGAIDTRMLFVQACLELKDTDRAVAECRAVLARVPDSLAAANNLAMALARAGRHAEALAAARRAVALFPDREAPYATLGGVELGAGSAAEAVRFGRRALRLAPSSPAASNLAMAFVRFGQVRDAIAAGRRAAALEPGRADLYVTLGGAWLAAGRPGAAVAAGRRALRLAPGHVMARSNLLMALQFPDDVSPARLAGEARAFEAEHGRPRTAHHRRHDNQAVPGRRLRIGYLSPDFRQHVASCFFEPLLAARDRRRVEAVCYSDTDAPDHVTEHLKGLADGWRDCRSLDEAALAEAIRADRIDILVDLAGHSAGNRMCMLARRPAPVQVTWLGYPDTTGLSAVDYRLVDAITDPEGEADAFAAETLVRLPRGFLCYRAPDWTPEPGPPPFLARGGVTFGSFNKPAKMTAGTVALWARVLRRVPDSRLLLKGVTYRDPVLRGEAEAEFARHGVAAERLEFSSWTPSWREHLELYRRIDVALDTFPYNGTTTTCEALWMGVPVVTFAGGRHAARVGASLLARVGLDDLVGADPDDFVERAARLAGDPGRLEGLRAGLRRTMAASALCDEAGFARQVEDAFAWMWERWCVARRKDLASYSAIGDR